MAGGETLQPAASKEGFRALRVSVDLEIAKGLTDLFPTLEDPGALVSNACALQLEADEVTTDFGPLPFVVFVRSDGSSNPPSNISVEPIPGRHRYRLGITLDDKHLRTTVFGAAQIGKATIISQGSLKPQPYITLGEQERGEGVLLLVQDPDCSHSIYMGQLENMPVGWESALGDDKKESGATQGVDGSAQSDATSTNRIDNAAVVPEAESRSIRDQVLERIREALSRSGISYSNLESPEDLIKHVYAPRVLNAGDEQLGFSGIVVVRPKKYSDERPDQITVSIWGEQPILYIQSDSDEFRHIGEGITTHFGKKRFEQFGEEEGVLLVMQREGWYEEYATEAIGLSRRWREAFKEDGRMVGSDEDQDRLESVELPASPYTETVLWEVSASNSGAGATSSLKTSGDVFSGSRHSSEDHALGRHDSLPRHCSYEDPERVRRERDRERDIEEEQRKYIGATPVVSEEDSPYAPVKYVRDKGGKWVPEDPENRRRGERQSRRGRSNPLGGMTVATPQTFTRIAEQPRRESASVPAEKTSGAKTGEQKRPEGRFKKKANKKPKKQLEKEEKQSKGGKK